MRRRLYAWLVRRARTNGCQQAACDAGEEARRVIHRCPGEARQRVGHSLDQVVPVLVDQPEPVTGAPAVGGFLSRSRRGSVDRT